MSWEWKVQQAQVSRAPPLPLPVGGGLCPAPRPGCGTVIVIGNCQHQVEKVFAVCCLGVRVTVVKSGLACAPGAEAAASQDSLGRGRTASGGARPSLLAQQGF